MKVDVPGLMAAAQKLREPGRLRRRALAPASMPPLAADPTSVGAAARLEAAALELWGCGVCAGLQPAHRGHAPGDDRSQVRRRGGDQHLRSDDVGAPRVGPSTTVALATLAPVPPILARCAGADSAAAAGLTGEAFSQLVHHGSSAQAPASATPRRTTAPPSTTPRLAVRDVAAAVPELWESPKAPPRCRAD